MALGGNARGTSRKKSALITGGAGFIGSHLVESLLDDGYRVNALEEDLGTTRLSQEWPDSADRAYEVRVRMRGKGQIAEFGFKNPQWTPTEIIVFVEDNFAVYWPELQSVSLFQRVNLEAIKPSSS